jgi:Tfp pilus assembly protein PilF
VSKPIPPGAGPDLLVAAAKIHEAAGRNDEADRHYQKALEIDGKHYDALLGYAHLMDRQSRFPEATAFYERATTAYPGDPAPLNDLALCLARRRMYDKAAESLRQAVAIAPTNKLYRNNLATVLLEVNDRPGALQEMTAAHGEAIAHYNIGCLLQRKGKTQEAAAEFRAALAVDPKLTQANEWLAKLERPSHAPTAVASRPVTPVQRSANLQVRPGAPNAQPARRWGQVSNTTTGPAPSPGAAPSYLLGGAAQAQNAPAATMSHPQSGWGQYGGGEAPAAPTPEDLDRADKQGLSALPPVSAEYYPPSRY